MRILLVTHFFPPDHTAGTETYTLGLAKALIQRKNSVRVLCAEDWETGERYWNGVTEDVFKGVRVQRIHLSWTKAKNPNKILYDSIEVERALEKLLASWRPDVVHVTSLISLGVGVLKAVKRAGIPLVLTLTDFWFLCPSLQLLRSDGRLCDGRTSPYECQVCLAPTSRTFHGLNRVLPKTLRPWVWDRVARSAVLSRRRGLRGLVLNMKERKETLPEALRLPDRIFSPSAFVQSVFTQNTSRKVDVLPHGHDLHWLEKYPGKTPSEQVRFGYIGQISPIKGVQVLVEAFHQAQLGGRARLQIWGDLGRGGQYGQALVQRAVENPAIKLCGAFTRESLGLTLAEIDVLVVPSIWYENAPLVIQEAFATGTPVITTNLGGMAEAVAHEMSGLLFERGDVQDLARQLRRAALEPGLLERLRAGIPAVRTVEHEVAELEGVYRELAARKPVPGA